MGDIAITTADGGICSPGGPGVTMPTCPTFALHGGAMTLIDITGVCAITASIEGASDLS